MNRSEYLLTCLAEECAEVAQRVSKALRFGLDEIQPGQPLNNRERVGEELLDLVCVAAILRDERVLDWPAIVSVEETAAKRDKIERFMAISRREGTLTEGPPK